MRITMVLTVLAGLAFASPVPQDIDWDAVAIAETEYVEPDTIPVVASIASAQQTTIAYQPSQAASSVAAAVSADPTDATPQRLMKRDCVAASDDTPQSFAGNTAWAAAATSAPTPSGYVQAFSNLQGSVDGSKQYGYSGYSLLDSYDPIECARRCDAVVGCYSFDVFFERDASTQPTDDCPNPSSAIVIKCTYWGSPVSNSTATNYGQFQDNFQVLIAGSNGYVNKTIGTPAGYSSATPLGNAAILAPLDCNHADTYMGVKIFTKGPFDTNLCAAACDATSAYNVRHPPQNAPPQICQFFNTYILYNETTPVGQYCAMYNETWPATYAKNTGQWRGKFHFNIGSSFMYTSSNSTPNAYSPVGCSNPASP